MFISSAITADVHHRGWTDACLAQFFDDVTACVGLELALQQVFLAGEVGLEGPLQTSPRRGGFFLFLFERLEIDAFLALEQLQAHIGSAEVA